MFAEEKQDMLRDATKDTLGKQRGNYVGVLKGAMNFTMPRHFIALILV